jgi:hypothetical protein
MHYTVCDWYVYEKIFFNNNRIGTDINLIQYDYEWRAAHTRFFGSFIDGFRTWWIVYSIRLISKWPSLRLGSFKLITY